MKPAEPYFDIYDSSTKRLRIDLQNAVTTYVNFSNPLCAVLWNAKKRDWLHEHFTQLYCIGSNDDYFWLDYLEPLHFLADLGDYHFLEAQAMFEVKDIIAFIKSKVDNGYYGMVFLDAYHLSHRRTSGTHEPLQMFWHGYDDTDETVFSIGFDSDHTYVPIKQSYSEITRAFEDLRAQHGSAPLWVKLYSAVLFCMDAPERHYPFSPRRVLAQLHHYLSSTGDSSKLRPEIRAVRGENAVYGSRVHDHFIVHLNNLLDDKFTTDYRFLHLLTEHKKLLHQKLVRVASQLNCANRLAKPLTSYLAVVDTFEQARISYLKQVFRESGLKTFYGQLKDRKVITRVIDAVTWGRTTEITLLSHLYEALMQQNMPDELTADA